jgi:hypothetical protein
MTMTSYVLLGPGATLLVTGGVIPLLGFKAGGVAASSFAAGFQSTVGNVAADSSFTSL